ncbi:MAG: hypothetical protein IJU95_01645, partial [Treponema sp.]|nr:hypothetical protein [Treponema sp.]
DAIEQAIDAAFDDIDEGEEAGNGWSDFIDEEENIPELKSNEPEQKADTNVEAATEIESYTEAEYDESDSETADLPEDSEPEPEIESVTEIESMPEDSEPVLESEPAPEAEPVPEMEIEKEEEIVLPVTSDTSSPVVFTEPPLDDDIDDNDGKKEVMAAKNPKPIMAEPTIPIKKVMPKKDNAISNDHHIANFKKMDRIASKPEVANDKKVSAGSFVAYRPQFER